MNKEQKRDLLRIILAGILFAAVAIICKRGLPPAVDSQYTRAALYLVPFLAAGFEVVKEALENIFHGEVFDENFLMLLASIGAFATGEYPEAVAVMLLYQIGEFFQDYAVDRSRESVSSLMNIVPEFANVIADDGSIVETAPEEVAVGSLILVRPGERIPLDGTVVEGSSFVDTSALTGESVPRAIGVGDNALSGCINQNGTLKCRTSRVYSDSAVARILELVENAASKKSKAENFITRFAKVYTPAVTIAALLLAVVPGLITGEWAEWIGRACTFLVISCPCALVISVPLGFFSGIGAASRVGVLVKGSNYLETIAKVKTFAFDKTGTLTKGEFAVRGIIEAGSDADTVLKLAAAVESSSTHPIAVSIVEEYAARYGSWVTEAADDICEVSGMGLTGNVDGRRILAGNAKLMEANNVPFEKTEEYGTIVYVAREREYLGAIIISDSLKRNAADAVRALKAAGVAETVMLTGDVEASAAVTAREAGVDTYYAGLMPEDKVTRLENLMSRSRVYGTVAFAGDGINDAPVLMRADVGIAMGSLGSDSAIEAADVVIMDDDLSRLAVLMGIARTTLRAVRRNIVLSLTVKAAVLILGALGAANMWLAVFADVGVAFIAIINSMRVLSAGKEYRIRSAEQE